MYRRQCKHEVFKIQEKARDKAEEGNAPCNWRGKIVENIIQILLNKCLEEGK